MLGTLGSQFLRHTHAWSGPSRESLPLSPSKKSLERLAPNFCAPKQVWDGASHSSVLAHNVWNAPFQTYFGHFSISVPLNKIRNVPFQICLRPKYACPGLCTAVLPPAPFGTASSKFLRVQIIFDIGQSRLLALGGNKEWFAPTYPLHQPKKTRKNTQKTKGVERGGGDRGIRQQNF